MLKLPKGLKKKKKGKKSKKDQELFTEEELEQYKREHQVQQEVEEHQAEKSENDEEWSKFAALTTGVDSILKKTQGDLDRIKSTSFFKRVPPPSEKLEKDLPKEDSEAVTENSKPETEEDKASELLKAVVELSESEEDSEFDDSAFDTTFIDKVETGELPLAYVPESPEEKEDFGPDPFDTGYAEKVIKGPEVSQRGKKLVNIGAAVEVLTGKVEASSAAAAKSRRQRRGIQNLLLESFEATDGKDQEIPETTVKTLLDEPPELKEDIPIDLSVSLHLTLQKSKTPEGENSEHSEFKSNAEEEVVDLKVLNTILKRVVTPPSETNTTDWDEFDLLNESKNSDLKSNKQQSGVSNLEVLLGVEKEEEPEVDPFDTAYVEKIVPKSIDYDEDFDPRAAEEEIDDEFNPRAEEEIDLFSTPKVEKKPPPRPPPANLSVLRKDYLGSSHNDLTDIVPTLEPEADQEVDIDPFDTSAVESLVAPGKTELKYLEQEFLEDDDFDPRAGEEPKPSTEDLRRRKSSLSLQITPATPKNVQFAVPDLLKIEGDSVGKKPLTPYYTRDSTLPLAEEAIEEDPFDTSFVASIEPTSVELDLIEKEIFKQSEIEESISDDDFNPRAFTPIPDQSKTDILSVAEDHNKKVLTPQINNSDSESDPFDTSAVRVSLQPSSAELKLIEDELIEKKPDTPPLTDIISDTQDNSIYAKILTPEPTISLEVHTPEDFDPFDTSIASNLGLGETEIKLIENEFIN